MHQTRDVLQEVDHLLVLLLFKTVDETLVVVAIQSCKVTVRKCAHGCCSSADSVGGQALLQGEFAEALTFTHAFDFEEPLNLSQLVEFNQVVRVHDSQL